MSLKKNFSWVLIGNITYAACQWGTLIVLTKFGTPELVGQFALGLAIATPIYSFTNLQLRGIQATDSLNEYLFSEYFGFRIIMTTIGFTSIVSVALFSKYQKTTVLIIILLGLVKAIESFSDVIFGLIQKHEQMEKISISLIFKGVFSLIFFSISLFYFKNLFVSILLILFVWLLIFLIFDIRNAKLLLLNTAKAGSISPHFKKERIKNLFFLALPLGVVILFNALNINIPRYFITEYFNEEMLGYFAAIAYLLVVGSTIVNAIGQSATPRLAQYYQSNRHLYTSLFAKMLSIAIIIGSLGIFAAWEIGDIVLSILYTEAYAKYKDVFLWIMVSAFFLYCSGISGSAITAARSFKPQVLFGVISTSAILMASYILIPIQGIVGAAMAMTIAFSIKVTLEIIQVIILVNKV